MTTPYQLELDRVVVDTREQDPLFGPPARVAKLDTGDYSIVGCEGLIALERKTLPDMLGCIGRDRERFERELERSRQLSYFAIVIETDLYLLRGPYERSLVAPTAVIGSLTAWSVRYGVPIWLTSDRRGAKGVIYRLLRAFAKEIDESEKKSLDSG